ncbi:MAG: zinc ribbon domain-containing protein [Solirubrobacterales bacterium]|nr:zinc ribbon domain-containing protein [Solirubrobacterales bacterium]
MSAPGQTEYCPSCQAPNSAQARYCRECGRELDPERFAAPVIIDDPEPQKQRWRPGKGLIIGLVALLALCGAGGAYLLTRGDEKPKAVAAPPPPPQAPPPTAKPAQPTANSPVGVIRTHWRAIAAGDFDKAYGLFSKEYKAKTAKDRWVGDHEDFAPKVGIGVIRRVQSLPGSQAFVFADIYSRDTGSRGDDKVCVRFVGKVRVVRQGGRWRYWADGPGDTFVSKGALQSSDKRCKPLFA